MWEYLPYLAAVVSSVIILAQDLRTRSVHLIPLLVLGLSGLLFRSFKEGFSSALIVSVASSFGLVIVILALLFAFYRLRREKILDTKLGRGDIILFFAAAAWLPVEGFLFFFPISNIMVLLGAVTYQRLAKTGKQLLIPLAGWQAILLCIYIPVYWILEFSIFSLY